MNGMPEWWAVLSAVFMLVIVAVMGVLAFVLLRVLSMLKDIQPKLTEAVGRMDEASKKISQAAESIRQTTDHVGGKARSISNSLEALALVNAKRFQTLATILTATSTVFKLFQMVQSNKAQKPRVDKKTRNKDNRELTRGVEQSGSSSGS